MKLLNNNQAHALVLISIEEAEALRQDVAERLNQPKGRIEVQLLNLLMKGGVVPATLSGGTNDL